MELTDKIQCEIGCKEAQDQGEAIALLTNATKRGHSIILERFENDDHRCEMIEQGLNDDDVRRRDEEASFQKEVVSLPHRRPHHHALPRQSDGHSAAQCTHLRSEPRQCCTTEEPLRYCAEYVLLSGRMTSSHRMPRQVPGGDKQCAGAGRRLRPQVLRRSRASDHQIGRERERERPLCATLACMFQVDATHIGHLSPHRLHTDWTTADIRRPPLQEATLSVAQFVSHRASSRRAVRGPPPPKEGRHALQLTVLLGAVRCSRNAGNRCSDVAAPRAAALGARAAHLLGGPTGAAHKLLMRCRRWKPPTEIAGVGFLL